MATPTRGRPLPEPLAKMRELLDRWRATGQKPFRHASLERIDAIYAAHPVGSESYKSPAVQAELQQLFESLAPDGED
jgi:hypothetical protein